MSVPEPVKEEKIEEDKHLEYLNEWKRLFGAINKEIRVTLYTEKNFREVLESKYGDIEFSHYCYSSARIVVDLPDKFKLKYLVGMTSDEMFSHDGVLADPLIHAENPYPCEPRTEKWSCFYYTLCTIERTAREEIPQPPNNI
jgi:hypothetical protein